MIENINNSLIHRVWCEYKVETTESDADGDVIGVVLVNPVAVGSFSDVLH